MHGTLSSSRPLFAAMLPAARPHSLYACFSTSIISVDIAHLFTRWQSFTPRTKRAVGAGRHRRSAFSEIILSQAQLYRAVAMSIDRRVMPSEVNAARMRSRGAVMVSPERRLFRISPSQHAESRQTRKVFRRYASVSIMTLSSYSEIPGTNRFGVAFQSAHYGYLRLLGVVARTPPMSMNRKIMRQPPVSSSAT